MELNRCYSVQGSGGKICYDDDDDDAAARACFFFLVVEK